jgi:hypothetical protein
MLRTVRHQKIADLITPILTIEAQKRLDASLQDGYSKAIARGASVEEVNRVAYAMAERAHQYGSKEAGRRIRQWTEAILAEQKDWEKDLARTLASFCLGALVGILCAQLFRVRR